MSAPPPERPLWRRELLGLGGYNLLAFLRRGLFYTFLAVYLRERLGMPVTAIAAIGACNAAASMSGQLLLWGPRADRGLGSAALMARGELAGGFGYLITGAVFLALRGQVSPAALTATVIGCLAMVELVWSMTDVGFRKALAEVTHEGNRATVTGVIDLVGLAGTAIGLAVAGLLYRGGLGYEDGTLWRVPALLILCGVPLIRWALGHIDREAAPPPPETASAPIPAAFYRMMGVHALAVLGAFCFHQNHTYFCRLPDVASATDGQTSLIRAAFFAVAGLAAPIVGARVDRIGARRGYRISLALLAIAPLLLIPTRSPTGAVLSMGVFGAVFATWRVAAFAYASELAPPMARGRCFALYNAVAALGWGAAGLLVGGPVADLVVYAGHPLRVAYASSFAVGAALAACAALLAGTIPVHSTKVIEIEGRRGV